MKRIFLNFLDPKIENAYMASAFGRGYKIFFLIMSLIFFDICAYGIPGLLREETFHNKIAIVGISFFLIFFFLLGFFLRKYIRTLRFYCVLLLIIYTMSLIEVIRNQIFDFCDPISIIAFMVSVNFGMNCLIYFNLSWLLFPISNMAVFSDIILRLFSTKDVEPEKYLKFLHMTIVNGLISYMIEKSSRINYLEIYNSNEFAKTFQHLIDEVFPTPIIIRKIQDSSVSFFNKAMAQMIRAEECKSARRNSLDDKIEEINAIKEIINRRLSDMKTSEKEESQTLINILDNFEEEILNQKAAGSDGTFLQRKLYLPKTRINSFQEDRNFNLNQTKEEEDKYFDVKIQKITWQNEECLMIIFSDITSIISLSKFKDIDVYKNRLLATVSHDLRTPLNGMMGMIETVENDVEEKRNKKILKMAVKFGQLLLSMINDILDFSKISNCQLSLNFELVNVIQIIKDVCDLIKFQVKNKGISFITEKRNLPNKLFISTDPDRLKQILLNLLSNALKFTFNGQIKLILEVTPQFLLKVSVQDTGIGIKEENIPKLFSLFGKLKQEDSSINKQGVGLGLVISQNLSRLLYHGPENGIHVESAWNMGSTFWFYIAALNKEREETSTCFNSLDVVNAIKTFQVSDSIADINKSMPLRKTVIPTDMPEESSFLIKKGNIMIVDDDQINLIVAKEFMRYFNLDFVLANNGKEAVDLIQEKVIEEKQSFDAILMDCNMPIMDGFTATQKIHEILRKHDVEQIPIIALTANVSTVDVEICYESGMNFYLAKPVSRKDLAKILGGILKIHLPP